MKCEYGRSFQCKSTALQTRIISQASLQVADWTRLEMLLLAMLCHQKGSHGIVMGMSWCAVELLDSDTVANAARGRQVTPQYVLCTVRNFAHICRVVDVKSWYMPSEMLAVYVEHMF